MMWSVNGRKSEHRSLEVAASTFINRSLRNDNGNSDVNTTNHWFDWLDDEK